MQSSGEQKKRQDVLSFALAAEAAGISVVPPKEDGSKVPIGSWKEYQTARPSPEQIRRWYAAGRTGIGFVCGEVSGNLELFEFDDLQVYRDFKVTAEAIGLGELVARIEAGYCETTPGGGIHWLTRCAKISGNAKFASKPGPPDPETGKPTVEVLIETRGEGGYAVVAPSNGKVHPSGQAYHLLSGGVENILTITPEERKALWDLARTFDQMSPKETHQEPKQEAQKEGRPGDDFNQRGDWRELLERSGWSWVYTRGEADYWRRPGKDRGISASTNHNGSDLLYVFSSSTPFETERGYNKFGALAVLEHNGDFQAAANALRDAGYGGKVEDSELERKAAEAEHARGEIARLQAEAEGEESKRSTLNWRKALSEALESEDPLIMLKEQIVPALSMLDNIQLDGALSQVVVAFRKKGLGVTIPTLKKEVRHAREENTHNRGVRQAEIERHQETIAIYETTLHRAEKGPDGNGEIGGEGEEEGSDLYFVRQGSIHYRKKTQEGPIPVPLCNFDARIVSEEIHDDGAEQTLTFAIEGELQDGVPLARANVPAAQYSGMSWVTANWGAAAVVNAGLNAKDHLRAAIQVLSGRVQRRTTFGHIGWRKVGGEWLYLHGSGAIGPHGPLVNIEVSLREKLGLYVLPQPPEEEELREAVRTSLSLSELAPGEIAYSLLGVVYRAPLGEALPVDFSVFLAGGSGAQKTELTAQAQAHWGPSFDRKCLPGNWTTTANVLEKEAFLVKDAVFVVDDFCPSGSITDVQALHGKADRLLRAQANRAGRVRMRSDTSLRPEYFPRGAILSSGEDVPRGKSLRARMWIVDVPSGCVDLKKLTRAQNQAASGVFAQAMSAYIAWLAPKIETLKGALPGQHSSLRAKAREGGMIHDRTPENIASLMLGWDKFLEFAVEIQAIAADKAVYHRDRAWRAFSEVAKVQGIHQVSEEPTERFSRLLSAAIISGKAHLSCATSEMAPDDPGHWGWELGQGGYQPLGDRIGWVDGNNVYLDPESSFAIIQRVASDQKAPLTISKETLWARMDEKGMLKERTEGRFTTRKMLQGKRLRVINLDSSLLYPGDEERKTGEKKNA